MWLFTIVIVTVVLATSGGFVSSSALAAKFPCKSDRGMTAHAVESAPGFDHARYAPAERELVKSFAGYTGSFDVADDDTGDGKGDLLANPVWVAYELKGVAPTADGAFKEPEISLKRPSDWYKEPDFAFLWTNRAGVTKKRLDNSYDGIGTIWNRGHLAQADHVQRIGAEASCNTHHFWNAVPQAAEMNQGPWLHLENYVAALANKHGRVWTIAGPIFDVGKPILFIGDPGEVPVAVPHALFKILVREKEGRVHTLAFVFEQPSEMKAGRPVPTSAAKAGWVKCNQVKSKGHVYDHRPRLVSVKQIEARTGLTFFAGHADRDWLESENPGALWPVEKKFWSGHVCGGQKQAGP